MMHAGMGQACRCGSTPHTKRNPHLPNQTAVLCAKESVSGYSAQVGQHAFQTICCLHIMQPFAIAVHYRGCSYTIIALLHGNQCWCITPILASALDYVKITQVLHNVDAQQSVMLQRVHSPQQTVRLSQFHVSYITTHAGIPPSRITVTTNA